jgi:ribosomal protein S18 acetylase RimI-like enzyme
MVRLEYRNYKPGDEFGLAKLHNHAFQSLGAGLLRTARLIKYRYIERPGFDPKEINVAEDLDTGQIVGQIMGTKDTLYFGGNPVDFISINDVATFPGYGGRGIAKKLMQMANEYAKEKGLEHGILSADPHGFPRSNIYLRDGYHDHVLAKVYVHFTNAGRFAKAVPILFPAFPGLLLKQTLPFLFANSYLKSQVQHISEAKGLEIRICYPAYDPNGSESYRKGLDRISREYYDGFTVYTPELWRWAKEKAPIRSLESSLVGLYYKGEQIGGAGLRIQNFYSTKFRFKIPVGVVHEVFMDHSALSEQLIPLAYLSLFIAAVKEAQTRKAAMSFYMFSENQPMFEWSLRKLQFHAFGTSAIMVKSSKFQKPGKNMIHTNPNITWAFQ